MKGMMNIELSKEMKQYLKDVAYINEQVMMAERARLHEIGKRIDLEITSESYGTATLKISRT